MKTGQEGGDCGHGHHHGHGSHGHGHGGPGAATRRALSADDAFRGGLGGLG